jgi:N-acetylneuraminic acid mutarotase
MVCLKRLAPLAVVALVAASCDAGSRSDADQTVDTVIGEVWSGVWSTPDTTLGSSELLPRVFVMGDEVLVVHEQNRGTTVEGEIYDPETGEAKRIASSGFIWRANAAMAWTGHELVVVGGSNGPGIEQIGAAYSPATDLWRPLPDPPGAVDAWENAVTGPAVWTGAELLLYAEGLAFDPATNEWRTIASLPGSPRTTEIAVWTGDALVIWGGCDATRPQCDDLADGLFTDGLTYEPHSDEWQPIASSPLSPGVHPQGVWTGQEILIYAGAVQDDDAVAAAAYNPAADSWRTVANPPLPPRRYATTAWTGRYFVLWGGSAIGSSSGLQYSDGAAYDPRTDTWREMPTPAGLDGRDRHAMVWVHNQLFITGGFETTGPLTFSPDTSD